ncbi:MAG: synthase (glutamine-hydrolyzing) [Micrococcaceae bacterium]|nr:synthase (glutamine-hydrolyzing) [Micrococcaceae bacterium]
MPRNVLVIQHVPWEGPGLIADALAEVGLTLQTRILTGNAALEDVDGNDAPANDAPDNDVDGLPPAANLAGIVVMGGPMKADDVERHPGLAAELQLIRDAVGAGVPVLGICLGHQLIALALGARLHAGATHEIGLAPVIVSRPDLADGGPLAKLGGTSVIHWHTDNADLPPGATLLASTAGCPNQAFRYGSATGFQFHLELDERLLGEWLDEGGMAGDLDGTTAAELLEQFRREQPERRRAALHAFGDFAAHAAARAAGH